MRSMLPKTPGPDNDETQLVASPSSITRTPTPRNLATALDAQVTPPKTSPPHAPEVVPADSAACKPEGDEQLDMLNNQAVVAG